MFLDGLDELDQKIVKLLIQNARMSYSEIGQRIGISRVAVKMRVQALEQKGVIEEYTTIINPQKISGAVSCYFEIEAKPDALMEVAELPDFYTFRDKKLCISHNKGIRRAFLLLCSISLIPFLKRNV